MVVDVEHVGGIRLGEPAMSADDRHVLVVVVRRSIAEVMAAGDHHAIIAERIDHQDLVVNHGVTGRVQLLLPLPDAVFRNAARGNNPVVLRRRRRALDRLLGFCRRFALDGDIKAGCGAAIGQRAADEQRRIGQLGLGNFADDAGRPRLEREEQDRLLGAVNDRKHFREIRRNGLVRLVLAAGARRRRIGREPDIDGRTAVLERDRRGLAAMGVGGAQHTPLLRGRPGAAGRLAGIGFQRIPVGLVGCS